jgi:hypothetical protein
MTHQVPWSAKLLDNFIKLGLLNDEEEFVIRTRIKGWSQVKQALELGVSTSTIALICRRLKNKYDDLVIQYPDIFPERKKSKAELKRNSKDPK